MAPFVAASEDRHATSFHPPPGRAAGAPGSARSGRRGQQPPPAAGNGMSRPALSPAELLVCTTCRAANLPGAVPGLNPDADRPGAVLARALGAALPEGIRVTAVECLSNCSRGCTVALRGPGRWTYVYGNLDPARDVATVIDGALRYRAAPDGLVPWRERPEHFRKNCIARIPPLPEAPSP